MTERYSAVDGKAFGEQQASDGDVDIFYTLEDQLFVEPQPLALPTQFELKSPIRMSRAEVAVARSHINVLEGWFANSDQEYSLILEDDVWFMLGLHGIWTKHGTRWCPLTTMTRCLTCCICHILR
jgi:GR25 family glycosyltransferase involved in LPS biosynthesis